MSLTDNRKAIALFIFWIASCIFAVNALAQSKSAETSGTTITMQSDGTWQFVGSLTPAKATSMLTDQVKARAVKATDSLAVKAGTSVAHVSYNTELKSYFLSTETGKTMYKNMTDLKKQLRGWIREKLGIPK